MTKRIASIEKETPAGLPAAGLSDVSVGTINRRAIVASRWLALGKEKAPRLRRG